MAAWERQDDWGWYPWTPDRAEDPDRRVYEDIIAAVDGFTPVDQPAGRAAADWLRTQAFDLHPECETWLKYRPGQVDGFFAIKKTRYILGGKLLPVRRKKPAAEIPAICKHRDADLDGLVLLRRAITEARRLWINKRDITLFIDGHDDRTAELLCRRFVLWKMPNSPRVWMPLESRRDDDA
jgi:hypothetical protein